MSTATQQTANHEPEIYRRLLAILADVDAVGKNKRNEAQKYNFRSVDDVADELNPLFAKHGVLPVPYVKDVIRETRASRNGGELNYTIITVEYRFYAADGSSVTATVVGEGMDSGDKSANKAMSAAFKYALLQTLCIPTSDKKDSEHDSHETVPQQRQQPQRAQEQPLDLDKMREKITRLRRKHEKLCGLPKKDDGDLFQQDETSLRVTGRGIEKLYMEALENKIADIFSSMQEINKAIVSPDLKGLTLKELEEKYETAFASLKTLRSAPDAKASR